MIPALTISELKSRVRKKYNGKEAVIGIMMGRYNIYAIQNSIDESYQYWHLNSGNGFDIYWAGYGEYWGKRTSSQIILNCANVANGVFFDLNAYVTFKNDFRRTKKITYSDTFQLVLCNVRDGIIKFDEHIVIDLEENLNSSTAKLRDIMENVIELSQKENTVTDINHKMNSQSFWKSVKGVSIADIINVATTAIATASSISEIF